MGAMYVNNEKQRNDNNNNIVLIRFRLLKSDLFILIEIGEFLFIR